MSSSRRPGGRPGSTNALKHGFYVRKIEPHQLDDDARLVTGLVAEIVPFTVRSKSALGC